MKKQDILMYVSKMDVFNYALYQNGIPPVRGIQIMNNTDLPVDGLSLRITSDFAFFHPFEAGLVLFETQDKIFFMSRVSWSGSRVSCTQGG